MENKDYILWFCCLNEIRLDKKRKLMEYYHNAENIFKAEGQELRRLMILSEKEMNALQKKQKNQWIKAAWESLKKKKISFCTLDEAEYPYQLRQIYDPPYGLFYKGKLPKKDIISIAVIGARACSNYGKEQSYYFSQILAKKGIQIISGLARGVDGFAHSGACHTGGRTFAVLGSGLDIIYPPENDKLYEQILALPYGGILSEYPPGTPPYRWNFPQRNRIISGLSNGVLIIEARKRSGSLITADAALEQGKDVFSLPGRAGDPLSTGTNRLIKQGAELVDNPEDILDFYQINLPEKEQKKELILETTEKIVYANLGLGEKHLDRLAEDTKMEIGKLMETLINLEEKGIVEQTGLYFHLVLPK